MSILSCSAQIRVSATRHDGDPQLCLIHHLGVPMNIHLSLTPLISLLAGILILVMPRLLNYIVAIYLILIGLVGLFGAGSMRI